MSLCPQPGAPARRSCPQPGCQTSQGEHSRCQRPRAGRREPAAPGSGQRGREPPPPPFVAGRERRGRPVRVAPSGLSDRPRACRCPAGRSGTGSRLTLQPLASRAGGAQQEQRQERAERRAPRGRRCPHAAGAAGAERSAAGRSGASGEGPALAARRKQRAVNHGRASRGPRRALRRGGPAAAPPSGEQRGGAGRGAVHRDRPAAGPGAAGDPRAPRRCPPLHCSRSQKLSVAGAGSPGGQAVWGRLAESRSGPGSAGAPGPGETGTGSRGDSAGDGGWPRRSRLAKGASRWGPSPRGQAAPPGQRSLRGRPRSPGRRGASGARPPGAGSAA